MTLDEALRTLPAGTKLKNEEGHTVKIDWFELRDFYGPTGKWVLVIKGDVPYGDWEAVE